MLKFGVFLVGLLLPVAVQISAQEPQILPQLQSVNFGSGSISLVDAKIGFASEPSTEDVFAAEWLAEIIQEKSNKKIEIVQSASDGQMIVFERIEADRPLPLPEDQAGPDSREAYNIEIDNNQVRITSRSSAGLFYAVQTLGQLLEIDASEVNLPHCTIEDWPQMVYRGFMMDMSHTQFPKMEEIKKQLDFLASWKANQYYFYSEASIELEGYPLLMADARFSREQVQEIIEYARQRHIDVIPNLELYGHIHDLFRLEHYADLAVVPHGGEFKPYDERLVPIIRDWIGQIADMFPSPFLHIGFDETWLIRKEAAKLGLPAEDLYIKMVNQTTDMVEEKGKIPLIYADMLQKFPTIIPKVSDNVVAITWHYFPKPEQDYEKLMGSFQKEGNPILVQSASINWEWVYPNFDVSFENINLLIKMGHLYQARGFIHSGWTDDTQTLMRLVRPDMAFGSIASWQQQPINREQFYELYAKSLYPAEMAESVALAMGYLEEASSITRSIFGHTDFAFFNNPFISRNLELAEKHREDLSSARLAAEKAQIHLMKALSYGIDHETIYAFYVGARMLDYLTLKYIYAAEINDFWQQLDQAEDKQEPILWVYREVSFKYHTRTQDMMDAITELKKLFRTAWDNEYEDFRLGIALGKYDFEFQNWLKLQIRLEDLRKHYQAGDPLPSLESLYN